MYIEPADILAFSGKNLIGKIIKWAEKQYKEEKSIISHTGLFLNAGKLEDIFIIEALFPKGVVIRNFYEHYKDCLSNCYLLKPLNLNFKRRINIVMEAMKYKGYPYGTLKLIPQLLDGITSKIFMKKDVKIFRKLCFIKEAPICSSLVALAYKAEGLDFGIKENMANPDDIWDYAVRNDDKYEIYNLETIKSRIKTAYNERNGYG